MENRLNTIEGTRKVRFILLRVVFALLILVLGESRASFAADFYDTALLTSSLQRNPDINFQKLCEYYGLRCKVIDLSTTA